MKAKIFYAALAVVAFALNWVWEMAQMFAFELRPDESQIKIFAFCTLASVIDVLVIIGIYGLLAKFNLANRVVFYLFAALFGAICAVAFELFAFQFGLWAYSDRMPVVPFLNVGLLPLGQLTILTPLAIWSANRVANRKRSVL